MNKCVWLRAGIIPVVTCVIAAGLAVAQQHKLDPHASEASADVEITGHVLKPPQLPPPDLTALKVPNGFRIERFAENVGNARMLAVAEDGSVYVTRREQADVLLFKVGPNGLALGAPRRVAGRPGLHGIAISKGKVYLAAVHEIFTAPILPDGSFGPLEMLIHDLPDAGQHNTRTVQIGPDNMMYISIGSTCNECPEPNAENAAILRASLDGKTRSIFASGLRDTIGWGWHPQTGELWGMDHGIDWLGDDNQPEELNRIEKGKRYGWPYIYADGRMNPHSDPPGGLLKSEWAKSSVPMVLGYTPHAAPMQMSFYQGGQFPQEYIGDAFVSMRGSWNRKPASGYEVVRVRFQKGTPVSFEPFVTGFLTAEGEHGRLAGNAVAKDGSLLFTDDRNGVIYRVSYSGNSGSESVSTVVPADPMLQQNKTGVRSSIAIQDPRTKTGAALTVKSATIPDGGNIPVIHSAYDQNASPPLEWAGAPSATKSYVLLMEDPDAKTTPLPVVHWVAWNIPSTGLQEGVPVVDLLREPKGMRQGANYAGVAGYRGPRPPAGDPPHGYHIQIFALDADLSLPPGSTRDDVLEAMKGHVVASGQLKGLFAPPDKPAKP
jgi:Raf kinase inhibitor-like YbhB/YbcL family protein